MDTSLEKMLLVVGLGGNGKSVLLKILERTLGRENVSAVALEDFANEFRLAATVGKLVNIVPEIGDVAKLSLLDPKRSYARSLMRLPHFVQPAAERIDAAEPCVDRDGPQSALTEGNYKAGEM
jgi:hypothetical protein